MKRTKERATRVFNKVLFGSILGSGTRLLELLFYRLDFFERKTRIQKNGDGGLHKMPMSILIDSGWQSYLNE